MNKQHYSAIAICGVLLLMSSILNSCINEIFTKAAVETSQVTSVTAYTAICGGVISADGGSNVTARGVCWSTSPNPTIENDTTVNAAGTGSYASLIKGLSPSTTYFVRAYSVNKGGIGYGLQISFTTQGVITDIDGNVYNIVIIGTQAWMGDNLKTTKYNDGTSIPLVSDSTAWSNFTTPGYCYYNNDVSKKNTYGALYNWYTVNTGKLAPKGWHIPTDAEWTTLTNQSNDYYFAVLPGGFRHDNGAFYGIGINSGWWSSTESNTYKAWYHYLSSYDLSKQYGFSVRCVRDY